MRDSIPIVHWPSRATIRPRSALAAADFARRHIGRINHVHCKDVRLPVLAEMRRIVRPGGHILLVNHFAAEGGPRWWVERAMAPASRRLGWHPDFAMRALLEPEEIAGIESAPTPPFGIFTLVRLRN